ncbi:cupin domain-containing protein [Dactylosporangium roseum]|uniref:Cupin domain-containing protein n=1 Tax=Dactylosporangium roseum TaxID=47989 RepID=A0ABY5Z1P2_9ACTN|nr:cupin domain-containing protein [Dactylosporangium roseum]UWZ34668.1 cupin domain-containing protein [Dactylosporangium roseum]
MDVIAVKPSQLRVFTAQFSPGARTAWHREPYGRVLHVLYGTGRVQRRGGPVVEVRAGDTIVVDPDEWHWHGAAPTSVFAVLSAYETDGDGSIGRDAAGGTSTGTHGGGADGGGGTEWGSHVSDAEYLQPARTASVPSEDLNRTARREACW